MSLSTLRFEAVLLPLLVVVWLAGARGIALAPWAAAVTAALAVSAATLGAARRWPRQPALTWLLALAAWSCAAAAILPVPSGEAARLVAIAIVACALAVTAATPAGALGARVAVVAAGVACSGWMIAERLVAEGRPGGPVEDPNRAATVAVLGLVLLPGLKTSRLLRGMVATGLLSGIALSGSRAALVALLAAAAVRVLKGASPGLRRLALVAGAVALGALLLRLSLDRDPLRFERVRIWGVAVKTAVAELPLGAGPGGYRDAAVRHNFPRPNEFARYHRIPSLAENDGLQVAVSLGLPGLVVAAGLLLSLLRRSARSAELAAVTAALLVTSSFHSQLAVPLVGWTATLAVSAAWGRVRFVRSHLRRGALAAVALVLATFTAVALAWPRGGLLPDGQVWLDETNALLASSPEDPVALATAEASAWKAAAARPRHPEAWRRLGDVRLQRAKILADPGLAALALTAYARAHELNPLDVWAVVGQGRTHSLLGDERAARAALATAVTLEPNCAPAWLELARLELELGEIAVARRSLANAEAALDRARGARFVSTYERAMADAEPLLLARLRASLEVRR